MEGLLPAPGFPVGVGQVLDDGGVLARELGRPVARGEFGAEMSVALVNDGPVTIIVSSREEAL